jgi:hypothetical protein
VNTNKAEIIGESRPEPWVAEFMGPAKSIVMSLALIAAGVILALAVAEASVRHFFPPIRSVSWYHYDPRYTMRYRENIDVITTGDWGDGASSRFRTNPRGFTGHEWTSIPAAGSSRLIVAGDSFTAGNGVDTGGAYPDVAERTLRASGLRVEVINLGVSAWGPQNALGYLSTEGADIRASCLIYGFFLGNDVADNVRYGLYSVRNGELTRTEITTNSPGANISWSWIRRSMRTNPLYDFLIAHSELFNILRRGAIGVMLLKSRTTDADSMPAADFSRALDLNDTTLDALAALAKRRFAGFGIILIPMKAELTGEGGAPFSIERAEQSRERVRRWGRQHRVFILDLTDELPRGRSANALYFSRDFHWNNAGQKLAGQLMAAKVGKLCAPVQ